MSPHVFDKAALIQFRLEHATRTLKDAHTLFDKEFIKENIIPRELGRMLHHAFESRMEGDYQDNTKVDRNLAKEILESADKFVRAIEEKLSKST